MAKDSFTIDLTAFQEKIKDNVVEAVREVAAEAFRQIVGFSPTPQNSDAGYSRGSYVLSHRIAINKVDSSTTVVPGARGDKDYGAASKAMGQISNLDGLKLGDTAFISNSLPYAHKVEYLGWHSRSPYNTFEKAVVATNHRLPSIIAGL